MIDAINEAGTLPSVRSNVNLTIQCNNYLSKLSLFFHCKMSLLTRPSVVFAIVFGCFAILIPRIFVPLFRSKPAQTPSYDFDERKFIYFIRLRNIK